MTWTWQCLAGNRSGGANGTTATADAETSQIGGRFLCHPAAFS
jgi:hypothetical protein